MTTRRSLVWLAVVAVALLAALWAWRTVHSAPSRPAHALLVDRAVAGADG